MNSKQILGKEMDAVLNMSYPELRERFFSLYGDIPCPLNTRTLRNRVLFKLQETYLGGLSEDDRGLLERLTVQLDRPSPKVKIIREAESGIRYLRNWKGKDYEVRVVASNCFECEGRRYKSLSAVARSITGTRWNGKLFFGVKK